MRPSCRWYHSRSTGNKREAQAGDEPSKTTLAGRGSGRLHAQAPAAGPAHAEVWQVEEDVVGKQRPSWAAREQGRQVLLFGVNTLTT